jgi:hypothetical protein
MTPSFSLSPAIPPTALSLHQSWLFELIFWSSRQMLDGHPSSESSFFWLLLQLYLAVLVSSEVTVTLYRLPVGLVS